MKPNLLIGRNPTRGDAGCLVDKLDRAAGLALKEKQEKVSEGVVAKQSHLF
jgi:hypothetical protein